MEHLQRLFEKFVPKVLDFRRHHCKELIPTSELNAVASLCVLFDALATEENGVSNKQFFFHTICGSSCQAHCASLLRF